MFSKSCALTVVGSLTFSILTAKIDLQNYSLPSPPTRKIMSGRTNGISPIISTSQAEMTPRSDFGFLLRRV